MAKSSPSASKSIFPTDTRIWTSKLLARPPQTRLQPVPGRRQMERLPSPLFPQDHTLFMPNTKADMPSRTGFSRSIWSLEKQISLTFHKPTLPKSSTASKRKILPPPPASLTHSWPAKGANTHLCVLATLPPYPPQLTYPSPKPKFDLHDEPHANDG